MRRAVPLPAALLALTSLGCAGTTGPFGAKDPVVATIDSIINGPILAGKMAGAGVAVIRGNDTIVFKGYGKADLEWDTPMPADAVFEIGSVTKQFTAVAMLQLVEQGKVDLSKDISTYLPEFNSRGRKITVRQLFDHTSGLRGYTESPGLRARFREDVPSDSMVVLLGKEPFDFEPGDAEAYNNSAYFLAGRIIEKVSGMSYGDYVEQQIFAPLGMTRSSYCDLSDLIPRRASGYDVSAAGMFPAGKDTAAAEPPASRLVRRAYLSHSWPHAAGSLCSTPGDLVTWNRALHGGTFLSAESFAELTRPGVLNDGTKLRYAMGLSLADLAGRKAVWHDGGINGFVSLNRYLPEDSLHVIVLWNSANEGADVAEAIIEAVLGKQPAPETVTFEGDLNQLTGTWVGVGRGQPMEYILAVDSAGQLTGKMAGGPAGAPGTVLTYRGKDTFTAGPGIVTFERANGAPSRIRMDMSYGYSFLVRK